MKFQGIIFDINGTLIDILTDEGMEEIYRGISHFLTYQGISIRRRELRDEYYRIMDEQRRANTEEYPEFDAVKVWREFLDRRPAACRALPRETLRLLPHVLAEMYRGISRIRLDLYPEVRNILDELMLRYKLAALSDAQSAWAVPEMRAVGIDGYFNPIVVSGDYGYRKPDKRIFQMALDGLGLEAQDVLFVGNDMYRDVYGARQMGLKTIFFSSNQGRKASAGAEPDYIIYQFAELRQAIAFLEAQ
ncbi:HAD family hydrolase [Fundidesulfovibrio terrae]|uniref:HAD family hydrolase n=1 Tax=Fundidesulfovibrio terrae TaxID=2922866 RepID=UPI001FAFB7BC|nr:HAD family hydrolase [Fundidesulfovibrio terrae]